MLTFLESRSSPCSSQQHLAFGDGEFMCLLGGRKGGILRLLWSLGAVRYLVGCCFLSGSDLILADLPLPPGCALWHMWSQLLGLQSSQNSCGVVSQRQRPSLVLVQAPWLSEQRPRYAGAEGGSRKPSHALRNQAGLF